MIHKFSMNGLYIVIDIACGAIHAVDKLVFDVLDFYRLKSRNEIVQLLHKDYNKEEIYVAIEELDVLVDSGQLFTEDIHESIVASEDFINRKPVVKALCMHIAHDCNLKCKYCFAGSGEYNMQRELMPLTVAKATVDFLIANSGNRRNLEMDFFGGEPLMNFDVVKETVHYARSIEKQAGKNFRFTITTNGILLDDEKMEFINQNMANVVLSIDGRKEVNDKMRPRITDKGSYDSVVPRFQKIAELRNQTNYYVRGTYTRENIDFARDVFHLAELGFKQISVEPVVAPPEKDYSIRMEDVPLIYEEYEKLAVSILNKKDEFQFFHFIIDLTDGPCAIKKVSGCGAGCDYLAVTPKGDLYPCHQFVGNEEFKMGDIYSGVSNTEMRKEFEKCNIYSKDECKSCWARFYCGGGCAANAHSYGGSIKSPYEIGCLLQKKRVECAIMINVYKQLGMTVV